MQLVLSVIVGALIGYWSVFLLTDKFFSQQAANVNSSDGTIPKQSLQVPSQALIGNLMDINGSVTIDGQPTGTIQAGSVVSSGKGSSAKIVFGDIQMKIQPNTTITFVNTIQHQFLVFINEGSLESISDEKFTVRAPGLIAELKGDVLVTPYYDDNSTLIETKLGSATVGWVSENNRTYSEVILSNKKAILDTSSNSIDISAAKRS